MTSADQAAPTALEIHQFACLSDNYCFLLHAPDTGETAVIDTPDVTAINEALEQQGWSLTHILNTHHHWDHAGGNEALKAQHGCIVIGPRADRERIPGIDITVGDDDCFEFGGVAIEVYDTPGHTRGHIVYRIPSQNVAFVGDTLFAMGCGRLFEGTPAQMWSSLNKILRWPASTTLYCAHEYTADNAAFALTVDPENPELLRRAAWVRERRAANQPTVPMELSVERRTNPFLRPDAPGIRATLGMEDADTVDVFAEIRRRKDAF